MKLKENQKSEVNLLPAGQARERERARSIKLIHRGAADVCVIIICDIRYINLFISTHSQSVYVFIFMLASY